MTRLTLHWHLRAIVNGVPGPTKVVTGEDKYGYEEYHYDHSTDAYSTGSGRYHPDDGACCTAYDESMASAALQSDDAVAYLDAVAHDPIAPFQQRVDASELLTTHLFERRCYCPEENREMGDEMGNAFHESELPKKSMRPGFYSELRCPNCMEGECLCDPDRPMEPNHCVTCGEKIEIPPYP